MPKKETKKDRQAALKQNQTAPFSAPELPPPAEGENDPPIIVSGGSVTITSKVFLSVSQDAKGNYVYKTEQVKVKKIKTRGQREEVDAPKSDGTFEIRLLDRTD